MASNTSGLDFDESSWQMMGMATCNCCTNLTASIWKVRINVSCCIFSGEMIVYCGTGSAVGCGVVSRLDSSLAALEGDVGSVDCCWFSDVVLSCEASVISTSLSLLLFGCSRSDSCCSACSSLCVDCCDVWCCCCCCSRIDAAAIPVIAATSSAVRTLCNVIVSILS